MIDGIRPSTGVKVLKVLPVKEIPPLVKVAYRLLSPVIRLYKSRKSEYIDSKVLPRLVRAAHKCKTREEIEELLGKPQYALKGGFCMPTSVDAQEKEYRIGEVYELRGCTIALDFLHDKLESISGSRLVTCWDVMLDREFRG